MGDGIEAKENTVTWFLHLFLFLPLGPVFVLTNESLTLQKTLHQFLYGLCRVLRHNREH